MGKLLRQRIKKTFVQYAGAKHQDATNFLFVILHFLDKKDPRTREILEATTKELFEIKSLYTATLQKTDYKEKKVCLFCVPFGLSRMGSTWRSGLCFWTFRRIWKIYCTSWTHCRRSWSENRRISRKLSAIFFSHLGYIMAAHYLMKYMERAGKKFQRRFVIFTCIRKPQFLSRDFRKRKSTEDFFVYFFSEKRNCWH